MLAKHAWNMQVGQVSEPIQINGHAYVLKLEQKVPKKTESFDQVKDSLKKKLQDLKRQKLERAIRKQ